MVHASTAYESLARLGNFSLVIPTPIITRPEATGASDILFSSGRVNDDVRLVHSTNRIFELFLLCPLGIQP
jgi:hypothetical protein